MLGGWVNPHRERQTIPQGQTNIDTAQIFFHANGQRPKRAMIRRRSRRRQRRGEPHTEHGLGVLLTPSVRGAYLKSKRGRATNGLEGFLPSIFEHALSLGLGERLGTQAERRNRYLYFPDTPRGCFSFFLRSASSSVRGANLKGCCE